MARWEALLREVTPAISSQVERVRLFFLIRSLEHGGAERQLTELVKRLDTARYDISVATFYDGGALRHEIDGLANVRVFSLGKKGRWDLLLFLWRLARLVRQIRPHVLHGYMGNANELCSLMAWLCDGRVVWGLRMSDRDLSQYDWLTALTLRTGAWLSKSADLLICNSFAGQRDHIARGYFSDRMVVVHNGIDTDRFRPDPVARAETRRNRRVADGEFVIGMVGRLDPQKDHPTFLRAAALLARKRDEVRFVCVGNGRVRYQNELKALAEKLGLKERVTWMAASENVLGVYNALDVATLTSCNGEGFANVVGEAMACAVPVIVTNCGDCRLIVSSKEQVVPIRQPEALAAAWDWIVDMPAEERARFGAQQRARIVEKFNVRQLVTNTVAAIESIR
jgi:glycosyltransferase involved in cell wall biosynthesis